MEEVGCTEKSALLYRGSRKVVRLFGKRRSSEVSDFSCLHGNERYGACDDVSTGIASIGIVSATIPIHAACGHGRTQGTPLNTPLKRKFMIGGTTIE